MKKLLCSLFCCVLIFSCTKLCNTGHKAANTIAKSMENRWQCDYQLAYNFFSYPVDKYICKDEDKFVIPGFLLAGACKIAVETLAEYSAIGIANKFKCNKDLVSKDLKASSNLCSILSLL